MPTQLQEFMGAATTYIVALLTMFGTLVSDNYTTVVQVLGFVLLIARLVQELPRAAKVVINTFRRTTVETSTATTVRTVETRLKKSGG